MDFHALVKNARTCRRFSQEEVAKNTLTELVDMAHIAPSARNSQIIRYAIIQEKSLREKMETAFSLGGALPAEQKPRKGIDSPTAYIVLLAPKDITTFGIMDIGIVAQTIQLGATSKDLACCIVGSFKKEVVSELLAEQGVCLENEELMPYIVLALGIPSQKREITRVPESGVLTYYHDENGTNMVPKLPLETVLLLQK